MDAPWLPMRTADCSDTLDRPAASSLSYCTACSGSSHQVSPNICLPLPPAQHSAPTHWMLYIEATSGSWHRMICASSPHCAGIPAGRHLKVPMQSTTVCHISAVPRPCNRLAQLGQAAHPRTAAGGRPRARRGCGTRAARAPPRPPRAARATAARATRCSPQARRRCGTCPCACGTSPPPPCARPPPAATCARLRHGAPGSAPCC